MDLHSEVTILSAKLAKAEAILIRLSKQKTSVELTEEEDDQADYEGAYNEIVLEARRYFEK